MKNGQTNKQTDVQTETHVPRNIAWFINRDKIWHNG